MRKLALRLIEFYRTHLSARKRMPTCKYYPSCSEYAFRAYETHGFFVASALSLWRLLRCNPWSGGGVDYVPDTPERARWDEQKRTREKRARKSPTEIVFSERPRRTKQENNPTKYRFVHNPSNHRGDT